MKSLIVMKIKESILYLLIFMSLNFSCSKKNKQQVVISYLTSDSIQFWDAYNFSGDPRLSYSFDKSGKCETYSLGVDSIRRIYAFDSIPDGYGICNRWKLINDSTLNIMCNAEYRILSYQGDSIKLRKLNNPEKNKIMILYKVKSNWNIDKRELLWRDSIIEARRKERKIYEEKIKSGEIKVITEKADD